MLNVSQNYNNVNNSIKYKTVMKLKADITYDHQNVSFTHKETTEINDWDINRIHCKILI